MAAVLSKKKREKSQCQFVEHHVSVRTNTLVMAAHAQTWQMSAMERAVMIYSLLPDNTPTFDLSRRQRSHGCASCTNLQLLYYLGEVASSCEMSPSRDRDKR